MSEFSFVYLAGAPVNSFELIRPIVEGVGYTMPQRELSVKTAMTLAWCIYAYYGLLHPWLRRSFIPEPFLLPAEVLKVWSLYKPASPFNLSFVEALLVEDNSMSCSICYIPGKW